PIRAEVATYWVRSPRNRFPLVIILPRLAWLRRFGELAFAVGRHASSPELDRTLDHGPLLAPQRCPRSPACPPPRTSPGRRRRGRNELVADAGARPALADRDEGGERRAAGIEGERTT